MDQYAVEREHLLEEVEHDEQQLRAALSELEVAVQRPFRALEHVAQHPVPWILGGLLIGFWLGTGHARDPH